jgi:hypothetical protein
VLTIRKSLPSFSARIDPKSARKSKNAHFIEGADPLIHRTYLAQTASYPRGETLDIDCC